VMQRKLVTANIAQFKKILTTISKEVSNESGKTLFQHFTSPYTISTLYTW